jgi:hypothetical protein
MDGWIQPQNGIALALFFTTEITLRKIVMYLEGTLFLVYKRRDLTPTTP